MHDWLVGGGAEKVVQAIHEIFPDAPIYTSYCTDEWRKKLHNKVVTGLLQKWPFSKLRKFLPIFRIWWFEHLDLTNYDLVISSSGNGEAKSVKKLKNGAIHVCYCHSPTHFYWDKYDEYQKNPGFGIFSPLAKFGLKILVKPLRKWDLKAAKRPDYFIANSTHIQNKIKQYYNRKSVVIHPPVDVARFSTKIRSTKYDLPKPRSGFITIGRQTPYKHTEIIIEACNKLNLPLTVIGNGPEHENLVRLAGPSVKFIRKASDKDIEQGLTDAKAFLFAAYEDFGITPVEAMAAGAPVIAYKAGGALDYVVSNKTGLFFNDQTADSLVKAIQKFETIKFDQKDLVNKAVEFSQQNFSSKLTKFLVQLMH